MSSRHTEHGQEDELEPEPSLENQLAVLLIVQHQRKNRFMRYVAIAGWSGVVKLTLSTLATGLYGAAYAAQGDWVPLTLACALPIGVGFLLHRPCAEHFESVRTVLMGLSWVCFAALGVVVSVPALQHKYALAGALGTMHGVAWLFFWTLSDKGIVPKRK